MASTSPPRNRPQSAPKQHAAAAERWRFIHIPRTAGTSIASVYGRGNRDEGHAHATAWRWPDCYKFAVVRNPWARAVSIYAYLRRDRVWTREHFKMWVAGGFKSQGELGVPDRYLTICDEQVEWLDGEEPIQLLRCERLEVDLGLVLPKIGKPRVTLPFKNSWTAKPWIEYYDSCHTFEQVAVRYARDVALYARLTAGPFEFHPQKGLT